MPLRLSNSGKHRTSAPSPATASTFTRRGSGVAPEPVHARKAINFPRQEAAEVGAGDAPGGDRVDDATVSVARGSDGAASSGAVSSPSRRTAAVHRINVLDENSASDDVPCGAAAGLAVVDSSPHECEGRKKRHREVVFAASQLHPKRRKLYLPLPPIRYEVVGMITGIPVTASGSIDVAALAATSSPAGGGDDDDATAALPRVDRVLPSGLSSCALVWPALEDAKLSAGGGKATVDFKAAAVAVFESQRAERERAIARMRAEYDVLSSLRSDATRADLATGSVDAALNLPKRASHAAVPTPATVGHGCSAVLPDSDCCDEDDMFFTSPSAVRVAAGARSPTRNGSPSSDSAGVSVSASGSGAAAMTSGDAAAERGARTADAIAATSRKFSRALASLAKRHAMEADALRSVQFWEIKKFLPGLTIKEHSFPRIVPTIV